MISHTGLPPSIASAHCRKAARRGCALLGALAALALAACQAPAPPKPPAPPAIKTLTQAHYEAVGLDALPEVAAADLAAAWPALLQSCRAFVRHEARHAAWEATCRAAGGVPDDDASRRAFIAQHLAAHRVSAVTLEDTAGESRMIARETRGRITGYYEPLLNGSRTRVPPFVVPLHRVPDDLLTIDLGAVYPELGQRRLRGRLDDSRRRVLPYWSRAELNDDRLRGAELLWVDDAIAAFFLQIQGSGRVRLPDGSTVRVGYADTNGHPYQSIGRILVERGELALDAASMQGIDAWARANPQRLTELLNQNPSYVFFRELPLGDPDAGPLGAMAVPLTPGYSAAVDPRFIPLGAPVVIRTQHPASGAPLARLVLAQDTGGAIRGPLRFDLFWGFGADAGALAGRQRHDVEAWLLLPRGVAPESLLAR